MQFEISCLRRVWGLSALKILLECALGTSKVAHCKGRCLRALGTPCDECLICLNRGERGLFAETLWDCFLRRSRGVVRSSLGEIKLGSLEAYLEALFERLSQKLSGRSVFSAGTIKWSNLKLLLRCTDFPARSARLDRCDWIVLVERGRSEWEEEHG